MTIIKLFSILFITFAVFQSGSGGPLLQRTEPRNDVSHLRTKRDTLDKIIDVIKKIPGVPNLPYRKMLAVLNPLRLRVGGDLKGTFRFRDGNMDVISALAARAGILRMNAGVALGTKLTVGKEGLALSYGGTLGYGSKNQQDGQLANGDTNVPYHKWNSNNVTA